jgi:hypothetical protein
MNYQEWIEQQIVNHQREVAKYEIALEVIRAANKILHPPKQKAIAAPAASKAKPGPRTMDGGVWRDRVLRELEKSGPQDSGTMIEKMGFKTKEEKQKIYNAMSQLKLDGKLDKSDTGIYSIPAIHHGLAPERPKNGTNG